MYKAKYISMSSDCLCIKRLHIQSLYMRTEFHTIMPDPECNDEEFGYYVNADESDIPKTDLHTNNVQPASYERLDSLYTIIKCGILALITCSCF